MEKDYRNINKINVWESTNSQRKSHTHLQFTQADTQTENCKKACLTNALKDSLKEERTGHNKVYKSLGNKLLE